LGQLCGVPKKSFAEQIRKAREAESLSPDQAAKAWSVSVRTLRKWESGEREPSLFVVKCVLFWIHWRKRVPDE
jgi:DNA-binding transcriptional regulator YiaG